MAKGKHAAALFEVITRGSRRARPGIIASPQHSASLPAASGDTPDPASASSLLILRLSYPTAVICALAVLTAVAGAYVAGRNSVWAPRPAIAATTDQIRGGPIKPSVITSLQRTAVDVPQLEVAVTSPVINTAVPAAPTAAVKGRNRVTGLNYVIIQSYPEENMAISAVKALAEHGIEATIEKKLPGWGTGNTTWYAVVGTHGFARLRDSSEYDAYVRRLKKISDEVAKPNTFRAFAPSPYKWRAN